MSITWGCGGSVVQPLLYTWSVQCWAALCACCQGAVRDMECMESLSVPCCNWTSQGRESEKREVYLAYSSDGWEIEDQVTAPGEVLLASMILYRVWRWHRVSQDHTHNILVQVSISFFKCHLPGVWVPPPNSFQELLNFNSVFHKDNQTLWSHIEVCDQVSLCWKTWTCSMTNSPSQGLYHLPGNPFKGGQYSESPWSPKSGLWKRILSTGIQVHSDLEPPRTGKGLGAWWLHKHTVRDVSTQKICLQFLLGSFSWEMKFLALLSRYLANLIDEKGWYSNNYSSVYKGYMFW